MFGAIDLGSLEKRVDKVTIILLCAIVGTVVWALVLRKHKKKVDLSKLLQVFTSFASLPAGLKCIAVGLDATAKQTVGDDLRLYMIYAGLVGMYIAGNWLWTEFTDASAVPALEQKPPDKPAT